MCCYLISKKPGGLTWESNFGIKWIFKSAAKVAPLFSHKYAISDKNPSNITTVILFILKNRSECEPIMQLSLPKWLCYTAIFSPLLSQMAQSVTTVRLLGYSTLKMVIQNSFQ